MSVPVITLGVQVVMRHQEKYIIFNLSEFLTFFFFLFKKKKYLWRLCRLCCRERERKKAIPLIVCSVCLLARKWRIYKTMRTLVSVKDFLHFLPVWCPAGCIRIRSAQADLCAFWIISGLLFLSQYINKSEAIYQSDLGLFLQSCKIQQTTRCQHVLNSTQ